MNKISGIIILAFIFLTYSAAQEKNNALIYSIKSHYGFIIAHHKELKNVSRTNPWGIEAEISWQLMRDKQWQYCYCYPKVGFSYLFINFDNPSVLGNANALYAFVEPVINADRKWGSYLRFGLGPVYLNKTYDSITNPDNTFYSSPISFVAIVGVGIQHRITENASLRLTGNFNHISNAGIKNPNKGINFPTLNFGLDYYIRPRPYLHHIKNDSIDLTPRDLWLDFEFFATGKADTKGERRFLVYGFNASVHKVVGRLNALSFGLEWTSDLADREEIIRLGLLNGNLPLDHRYAAFLLGHDLILGRFIFSTELGVYVYSPFQRKDEVYQRYGLTYFVSKSVFFGLNIKAHGHVADFMDFRTGISF
jgi:hypothetical protein